MTTFHNTSTKTDLPNIKSALVTGIILSIKQIQKRLKDPDVACLSYYEALEKMTSEFTQFATDHGSIFTKVVGCEDLSTIASILYYKDKVDSGAMTESEVSSLVNKKYIPEKLLKIPEQLDQDKLTRQD